MILLSLAGTLCLLSAAGLPLLRWLRPEARLGPLDCGLLLALGAAWIGLLEALLFSWMPMTGPARAALQASPLAALLLWRGLRRAAAPRPRGEALRPRAAPGKDWIGFLPALAVALCAFWLACQRPVWNVDAQMRWVLHAQWIGAYGTALPERVQDPSWALTHPSYPPLLPAVLGTGALFDGSADYWDRDVRALGPLLFLALLAVVYGHARGRAPRAAPWITLAFALTPCLAYLPRFVRGPDGPATTGLGCDDPMADVPLALLLTAAAVAGLELWQRPTWRAGLLCALLGAGAALTKQEGMAYAPAMFLVLVLLAAVRRDRARLRAAGIACAGAAGAALAWKLASASMPVMPGEDYLGAGFGALFTHLDRLPGILGRVGQELASPARWGPLWLVPLAWLVLAGTQRARLRSGDALPALWLLLGFGLIVAAFLATGWREGEYQWLMDVSLTRLLIHHAPLCALLAAQMPELAGFAPVPASRGC